MTHSPPDSAPHSAPASAPAGAPASGGDWLSAACGQTDPAVLVTVAVVEGSGPRAAGAAMLFTADGQFDTIGGGHLELKAGEIARSLLAAGEESARQGARQDAMQDARQGTMHSARLQRFALGPTLGQCCGGVTFLCFELLDAAALAQLRQLQAWRRDGRDGWRLIALDAHRPAQLIDGSDAAWRDMPAAAECRLINATDGRRWLATPFFSESRHLVLFGAGHVGAALVRALAPLPCRVTWVDERAELFPHDLPPNVAIETSRDPLQVAAEAPPDALFLVMTHSHALDQQLADAILRRKELAWFGLIGSKTKRMLFEHRLAARGIDTARLARMTCPIGLPGIGGKEPAVIAASVCAQLLQVWQTPPARTCAGTPADQVSRETRNEMNNTAGEPLPAEIMNTMAG
jgi:xanthine dehydrogenase accessory factor